MEKRVNFVIAYPLIAIIFLLSVFNIYRDKPKHAANLHLYTADKYDYKGEYLYFGNIPLNAEKKKFKFDINGLPMVEIDNNFQYNPISIAQYGLQEYSYYIKDQDKSRIDKVLKCANWLVSTQDKHSGKWFYNYDYEVGGMNIRLKAPFASAMAQGQAMSLLTRAYILTNNKNYIDSAELAIKPLEVDVKDGGLRTYFKGYPHYEEFPTQPSALILNGFMFCLFGLYDLGNVSDNQEVDELYKAGMDTLIYTLPYYDDSKYKQSYYHLGHLTNGLKKPVVNKFYHNVHVVQLKALNSIYPNDTLEKYFRLWETYLK